MSMLLVVGIMISYICSAITDLCITFANDSDIANLTHWAMGSFSGSSWSTVKLAAAVVFPTAVVTFLFSKPISAYLLGEGYAQSMGIRIRFFRVCIILLSSLLSACVTALAGPISFGRHCRSAYYKTVFKNDKAGGYDSCNLFVRRRILYVL